MTKTNMEIKKDMSEFAKSMTNQFAIQQILKDILKEGGCNVIGFKGCGIVSILDTPQKRTFTYSPRFARLKQSAPKPRSPPTMKG